MRGTTSSTHKKPSLKSLHHIQTLAAFNGAPKGKSNMLWVDYQALNQVTIKYVFFIPSINELLAELHGVVFFSKLNINSKYDQIQVYEEDTSKTTFQVVHHEFWVMSFGLATLRWCFFNGILDYNQTREEHENHPKEVLKILRQHQLFVKKSKWGFANKSKKSKGFTFNHYISCMITTWSASHSWPLTAMKGGAIDKK